MQRTVLLIGGCGFLGQSLAEYLSERGHHIKIFDIPEAVRRCADVLPNVEFVGGDFAAIEDEDGLFAGVGTVVHLVHTTIPATSMKDMAYDVQSNVIPSIRLFHRFVDTGIRRVVFLSSGGTVYGVPNRVPVMEDDATDPISPYGVTKLTIEKYLHLISKLHGFEGISIRLSNPYGRHQLPGKPIGAIANFLLCAARGQEIEVWGDGSVVRDYIYISDVVEAIERIIDIESIPSGAYNLGSGKGHSLNEVIDLIRMITGKQLTVSCREQRDFDVPRIVLDCTKLRSRIYWTPIVELPEGIEKLWHALQGMKSPDPSPT